MSGQKLPAEAQHLFKVIELAEALPEILRREKTGIPLQAGIVAYKSLQLTLQDILGKGLGMKRQEPMFKSEGQQIPIFIFDKSRNFHIFQFRHQAAEPQHVEEVEILVD